MSADDRIWLVHSAEGSCGPYTGDEMNEFFRTGVVTIDTYVWREGWPEWQALKDVPELLPPPPPPPPSLPPVPPPVPSAPPLPSGPPGGPFAPAPALAPLPTSPLPAKIRELGAPVETEPAAPAPDEGDAIPLRQVQIALAAVILILVIVVIGAVPRPWWDTPALALSVFGVEPDAPEDTASESTNTEDDKGAPAE